MADQTITTLTEWEAYQVAFLTCRGWIVPYENAGYWMKSGKTRIVYNRYTERDEETDQWNLDAAFYEEQRDG
jgi:hypothetical protein